MYLTATTFEQRTRQEIAALAAQIAADPTDADLRRRHAEKREILREHEDAMAYIGRITFGRDLGVAV